MPGAVVQTVAGKVRGSTVDGIQVFRGIPFGGPTGGASRFRPPTPPQPWRGIRDTTSFGQTFIQLPTHPDILAGFGASPPREMGEDALALNLWTPAAGDHGRRPVLAWIHGGGYYSGSAFQFPFYDGAALARRGDVVVVTFNYRLGVFGFLHLGELVGDTYAASGNVSVLDHIAALQWIRDNIEAFGGDPGNVTVFGSSAGGHAATTLLAVPAARGLFHRVAAQSGHAAICRSQELASRVAKAFLAELDVSPNETDRLQVMPADRLLAAQLAVATSFGGPPMNLIGPVVDGDILPVAPLEAAAAGSTSPVPLLIGTNGDEASCRTGALTFAERQVADAKAPVFVYEFTWGTRTIDGEYRSCHGLEGPFVFDNVDCPLVGDSPGAGPLAARMSDAWIAFARGGDPNHAGLPRWPPHSLKDRASMTFDVECHLERTSTAPRPSPQGRRR